jgi:hypothetical protein
VQQEPESRQDFRGRLKYARDQQQVAHPVAPPLLV